MPNYDTLFDKGLITFSDDGHMVTSPSLSSSDIKTIGIKKNVIINFDKKHQEYLAFHRDNIYDK
ncbi:hypothetical protein D3C73_1538650 [compost metagenome]